MPVFLKLITDFPAADSTVRLPPPSLSFTFPIKIPSDVTFIPVSIFSMPNSNRRCALSSIVPAAAYPSFILYSARGNFFNFNDFKTPKYYEIMVNTFSLRPSAKSPRQYSNTVSVQIYFAPQRYSEQ